MDSFATLKQHNAENGILCDFAPPTVSECNIGANYKHKTPETQKQEIAGGGAETPFTRLQDTSPSKLF